MVLPLEVLVVDGRVENMAMAEAIKPFPERQELALGEIGIKFKGISLSDENEFEIEDYVRSAIARMNSEFHQSNDFETEFEIEGQKVEISDLRFKFVELEDGSVIAKAKILGAAVITSYGLVASYPSFKEAVPVLRSDLEAAFAYVLENIDSPPPEIPMPHEIELFMRDEDDILAQIEKLKRY